MMITSPLDVVVPNSKMHNFKHMEKLLFLLYSDKFSLENIHLYIRNIRKGIKVKQ
jgi:hypothetical protein